MTSTITQATRFLPSEMLFIVEDLNFDVLICACRYVCLGGSSSPTPSDGAHGYLCPKGHSCPVGSILEVPCEPGTYSPASGAAICRTCPRGTVCPSTATQEPSICPAGEASGNTHQPVVRSTQTELIINKHCFPRSSVSSWDNAAPTMSFGNF